MSRKKEENKKPLLNEEIEFEQVRCLGEDGTQYGIISSDDALEIATKEGLDLVLIAPNANPPVVKIMDYNKFKYQQEKKAKEAKKKQAKIEVKEIKLTAKTAQNDLNYKIKHALEFLSSGKHVKFRVFLRGREMGNPEAGIQMLEHVAQMIGDKGVIEKKPHLDGRFVNMYVLPPKEKKKK